MSITITTDVFCDICPNWTFGTTGSRPRARVARRNAKRAGWVRQRRDGKLVDICPLCKNDEQEKTNA